ncbi:DUF6448 family protein [Clostridium sp. A1-XYC3]|uniref:DUF6448 family protein n=1 Tax=Clostridium tanneri TaxID=3037988 RepID=A0ABU4JV74_9CLOT|nr:DUF6448 family protein [Clostridium sp. A1-XYC3]MDW8802052.1 DUF6448 family protein [Clostridium sp. A1-XYC3]
MKTGTKAAKFIGRSLMALSIVAALPVMASAHCDTMEGPTISDAKKALESNNVNYALKWVQPENEKEITQVFEQAIKAKEVSAEAKDLADKKFFEELVKVHRAGEGAPFTGVKPVGTPIDEKVAAADKAIEIGDLSPLEGMVPEEKMPELIERFEEVMALKNFDVNNVDAGREYIEAYVSFFKFAEGEEEGHAAHGEAKESAHAEAGESQKVSNPKTADMGTIPFVATSAVTGLAALALGLKKKSK